MYETIYYPSEHDCTARGRNGAFKPQEIYLNETKEEVHISVFSRRRDGAQPIYFAMPKEIARELIRELEKML